MTAPWTRLSAWLGRLDTALRELTFGTEAFRIRPHEPIAKVSGGCLVCSLPLDHPRHGPSGKALSETEVTL